MFVCLLQRRGARPLSPTSCGCAAQGMVCALSPRPVRAHASSHKYGTRHPVSKSLPLSLIDHAHLVCCDTTSTAKLHARLHLCMPRKHTAHVVGLIFKSDVGTAVFTRCCTSRASRPWQLGLACGCATSSSDTVHSQFGHKVEPARPCLPPARETSHLCAMQRSSSLLRWWRAQCPRQPSSSVRSARPALVEMPCDSGEVALRDSHAVISASRLVRSHPPAAAHQHLAICTALTPYPFSHHMCTTRWPWAGLFTRDQWRKRSKGAT
jgi:hypothetical protein